MPTSAVDPSVTVDPSVVELLVDLEAGFDPADRTTWWHHATHEPFSWWEAMVVLMARPDEWAAAARILNTAADEIRHRMAAVENDLAILRGQWPNWQN
jgi:hypothetical protein